MRGIDRALIPSGHLFLWVDKFHLCQGVRPWFDGTSLDIVDLVTWDKGTFGMGYRTRRRAEYCVVLQKQPRKAKGVWKIHNIPDVLQERVSQRDHPHTKPIDLQGELMAAVSHEGDFVIDPAAGSFSVLLSAQNRRRHLPWLRPERLTLWLSFVTLGPRIHRAPTSGCSETQSWASLPVNSVRRHILRVGTGSAYFTRVPNIDDLDAFLKQEIMPDGVSLARKPQIKRSAILDFAGSEPDFMVFKRRRGIQTCHIVELKDGHVFDTKRRVQSAKPCTGS